MLTPAPRHWWTRMSGAALLAATCVMAACGLQQPDRGETEGESATTEDPSTAGHASSQRSAAIAGNSSTPQLAAAETRSSQQSVDSDALEYCRERASGSHPDRTASVSDSMEVEIWGRGDTVLIAGNVEWQNSEGKTGLTGWSCDMIRGEDGKWRQWHFGVHPIRSTP